MNDTDQIMAQLYKLEQENASLRFLLRSFEDLSKAPGALGTIFEKLATILLIQYNAERSRFYLYSQKEQMIDLYVYADYQFTMTSNIVAQKFKDVIKIEEAKIVTKNKPTQERLVIFPLTLVDNLHLFIEFPVDIDEKEPEKIITSFNELIPAIRLTIANRILYRQLNQREREMQKILDSETSAILSIDQKDSVLFANKTFQKLFNYTLEELQNNNGVLEKIFPPSFLEFTNELEPIDTKGKTKKGKEIPCKVQYITVEEEDGDKSRVINIKDLSSIIQQQNEIYNLRKNIANSDDTGVVFFRFSKVGGEVIQEDLRAIKIQPQIFSSLVYSSIGQGQGLEEGVFGPIPAPQIPEHRLVAFTFKGKDDKQMDTRMKGEQYYLMIIIFPEKKTEFLVSNKKIESKFKIFIRQFEYPNRMKKDDLLFFREIVFIE